MKSGLTKLLEEAATVMDCPQMHEVAEYLIAHGVLVPPVKIGQTVYAPCIATTKIDEPILCEQKVEGVALNHKGEWCIFDNYGALLEIGADVYLTREEGQRVLEEQQREWERYENARNTI